MPTPFRSLALSVALVLSSAVLAWASTGETEQRVALVIGNSNYAAAAPLRNPINDAEAIGSKLEEMGFDVTLGTDLTYDALRDSVRSFARVARTADVTLFYYAGHGIAVDGQNYIVPVDAKLNHPVDWEFEVYDVAEILRLVDRAPGPSLIFLDACRDNPLAGILAQAQGMASRSLNHRGIARIPTESFGTSGTVIAYATEPGQIAADGTGENSPFAEAMLARLDTPGMDFASVTSLITGDVLKKTDGVQRPRFDVSLTGPLVLTPKATPAPTPEAPAVEAVSVAPAAPAAPAATAAANAQAAQIMFEAALASNDIADFEIFVQAFPNSPFTPMAENRIARLQEEQAKAEEEVVEVAQAASAPRLVTLPLSLPLTTAVTTMPSSEATDRALALDYAQRKALQLRLNLSGFNVGTADGAIGPMTRRGIKSWQESHGFVGTGFLNTVQHQFLVASADQAFKAHMAANPTALAAPVRKTTRSNTTRTSSSSTRKQSSGGSNQRVSDFLSGAAVGAAGALLLKR